MKHFLKSTVFTTGLAIFSMFFGAGNLIYPIQAGLSSGTNLISGLSGYLVTAMFIPILSLIAIILFNGNYQKFFERTGIIPGKILIFFCMAVIGPCIAMSRCVTFSYEILAPFFPSTVSLIWFSIIACLLTYLATKHENKVIDILGRIISPALLVSLAIIVIKGLFIKDIFSTSNLLQNDKSCISTFAQQTMLGYTHLDLLAGIFFGSIVLVILKNTLHDHKDYNLKTLTFTGMISGIIGCILLGIVYAGLFLLGSFYGKEFTTEGVEKLFSLVSFKIMGSGGAFVIAIAVSFACFSTIVALAMVLAEYIQNELSKNKFTYHQSLIITMLCTFGFSIYGLSTILKFSGPVINTAYPILIVLTLLNIAYKLFDFKPIKIPVLITTILSIYYNSGLF